MRERQMRTPFRFTKTFTLLLGTMAFTLQAASITVNSVVDTAANDGVCTLREAITAANTNDTSGASAGECAAGNAFGMDTIAFNVGGGGAQTINLGSLLPIITSRVNIDGTTQPSYAPGTGMIRVDAGTLYTSVLELGTGSTSSIVKGMMITRGAHYGIFASSDSNNFQGNYIGTNGSSALASENGLALHGSNNVVGGTTDGAGNLIAGAWSSDVFLALGGNLVQGNIIGTDITGTTSMAVGGTGVFIYGTNNVIGGTVAGAGNLISGNGYNMVFGAGAKSNTVQGNKIGTNLAGSAAVTGSGTGILIGAEGNVIGGSASGAGNLISGNAACGIWDDRNGAISTMIQGNYIGTNLAGTAAIPNGKGIWLTATRGTVVGGASSGEGNVVSGNTIEGIWANGPNSTPNIMQGNRIGTNAAGTSALPNNIGLRINDGNNTIGGSSAGAGNLISGNTERGVSLSDGVSGTVLRGNFIGTNAAGSSAIPNGYGVLIDNAPSTTIGGGRPGKATWSPAIALLEFRSATRRAIW
ncbi:MAG: CSLREA domain-containing protein [Xanthomonadales bacterium]|nr:CSLREA domain-containing protein [Xanthomonadales bacterium]